MNKTQLILSFVNVAGSLTLGICALLISINTRNNSIEIERLRDQQEIYRLRIAAWKIYNTSDMLIQDKVSNENPERIKGDISEMIMSLEGEISNSVLTQNDTLFNEWQALLTTLYFDSKYFNKLGQKQYYYADIDSVLSEVDSLSFRIFKKTLSFYNPLL